MNFYKNKIETLLKHISEDFNRGGKEILDFCDECEAALISSEDKDYGDNERELLLAKVHYIRGRVIFFDGNYETAIFCYEKAIDLFKVANDAPFQIKALIELVYCYEYTDFHLPSRNYLAEAFELAIQLEDKSPLGMVYYAHGKIYAIQGSIDLALENTNKAYDLALDQNDDYLECLSASSIGNLLGFVDRADEGIEWVENALSKSLDYGMLRLTAYARLYLTALLGIVGRNEEALEQAKQALVQKDQIPVAIEVQIYIHIVDAYLNMHKIEEALAVLPLIQDLLAQANHSLFWPSFFMTSAKVYEANGNEKRAIEMLGKYVSMSEEANNKVAVARMRLTEHYYARQQAENLAESQRLKMIELAAKNRELEMLNKEKDEIMQLVAHDLRNPLTSISLISKLLCSHADQYSSDKRLKRLQQIQTSADNMDKIISMLLEVQQIENQQADIEFDLVPIAPLIESVISQVQPLAKNKNIEFDTRLVKEGHRAWVDSFALTRVLENLFSNGIKFSPAEKRIQISTIDELGKVKIFVKDQGLGFSAEDLTQVFNKFARLSSKPIGDSTSTGLGLYIVKKLIESMKGSVDLQSPGKNQGSTFVLTLLTDQTSEQAVG